MRRLAVAAAAIVCGFTAVLGAGGSVRAQEGGDVVDAADHAPGPEGVLSAELDAFALRVEYDIPLPLSTGTIPHVVGEVRRSNAGEAAKGLSGAPSHFDAVVGGTYYDPDKSRKGDENLPPHVECFYPGTSLATRFDFPTDTRAETGGMPATSYATANCAPGPAVQLRVGAGAADLPMVEVRAGAAEGEARPVENKLVSTAFARADGVRLVGGAVTVGAVEASGASSVTGAPGGAVTSSRITLQDVDVAGVRFSVANDRLIVGGREVPLDSAAAERVVESANAALKAAVPGCRVDLATEPDTFPQGFLLSRKPPLIGVQADGTAAASMRAGLQVLCDVPQDLSEPSGFSPQRLQVVLGFVYTGTYATSEPAGFTLGNLVDVAERPAPLSLAPALTPSDGAPLTDLAALPTVDTPALDASAEATESIGAAGTRLVRRHRTVPAAAVSMAPLTRALLFVVAFLAWAALTHIGLRRLRGVTQP